MNGRVILALVRLRLTRVFRERTNLVWLFLMPMAFSFLMGRMLGDWSSSGPSLRPPFMVYDQDGGPAVEALLGGLRENPRFLVVVADSVVAEASARAAVEDGTITAALFIPAGFTHAVAQAQPIKLPLFYDSDRLSSQTVRTRLDEALLRLNTLQAVRELAQAGDNLGALPFDPAAFDERWERPRVTLESGTLGRPPETGLKLDRAAQHVGPAYTIFFVMMFLMMSAKDLVVERQERTLARLTVSRASAADLVVGFFLGGLVLGLIQAGLLLACNTLPFFEVDYGDSPGGLILVVVLFGGFCAAASVLLGATARTGAQADGLGMASTMILAALGGLWWPLEIVPAFMQKIGGILPTGQAITVFHDMIGRGYGVAQLAGPLTGLALWFVVMLGLSVWRLRRLVRG